MARKMSALTFFPVPLDRDISAVLDGLSLRSRAERRRL